MSWPAVELPDVNNTTLGQVLDLESGIWNSQVFLVDLLEHRALV